MYVGSISRFTGLGSGAVGAIEDTASYQACVGKKIEGCGNQFPPDLANGQWSAGRLKQLNDCIASVEAACRQQALNAASALDKSQVRALQTAINKYLTQNGYKPIAVDGILGPNTCGASIWAASAGYPIVVPGACPSGTAWAPVDAGTASPAVPAAPAQPPVSAPAVTPTPYMAPSSFNWGLWLAIAAGIVAGVGGVYYYRHHKG